MSTISKTWRWLCAKPVVLASLVLLVLLAATAGGMLISSGSSSATSSDVLACQHFKAQGDKLRSEAAPTLADFALAAGWVESDATLASDPVLKTAFTQDSKAISDTLGSFGDTQAQQDAITKRGDDASAKIKSTCARLTG